MKKFIIILVILLAIGGISAAWEFVRAFAYTFFEIFVSILPFLDLEQTILSKAIAILIVQALCATGFAISYKTKLKAGKIISIVADAIATLLLSIA